MAENTRRNTEQWLHTAHEFTNFFTWEIDPDRRLMNRANPCGELTAQVYEPVDSWRARVQAEDRLRWVVALDESMYSKALDLAFHARDASGRRHYVAQGVVTEDPITGKLRLLGVSVQLRAPTKPTPSHEQANCALYGVQDLLNLLSANRSLDGNARRNLDTARTSFGGFSRQRRLRSVLSKCLIALEFSVC